MLNGKVRTGSYTSKENVQHRTWTITANIIRRIDYNQPTGTISDANEDAE